MVQARYFGHEGICFVASGGVPRRGRLRDPGEDEPMWPVHDEELATVEDSRRPVAHHDKELATDPRIDPGFPKLGVAHA